MQGQLQHRARCGAMVFIDRSQQDSVAKAPLVAVLFVGSLDRCPRNSMRRFFLPRIRPVRCECMIERGTVNILSMLRKMIPH